MHLIVMKCISGMSSDVVTESHGTQNIGMDINRCTYSISSKSACQCQDVANYKCSHCSFSFCLQHGLQHQQELKQEIHYLLAEAQVRF
jgi:transposase-like protein